MRPSFEPTIRAGNEATDLAREAAQVLAHLGEEPTTGRKKGFTMLSDVFIDDFMPLMKRSECNLFLAILRRTRFDLGRFIEFRASELGRAAGISGRFFRLALYRLREAGMLEVELHGKTWSVMVTDESKWKVESFRSREGKNYIDSIKRASVESKEDTGKDANLLYL